ncbi:Flp family type IVb pilin [Ferrimonas futtsuensis]|uniref:Flp family type IVb pilin n=1 Tax=Ferrimonas futtsuensis TaxID=364764 RepID=UPI000485BC8B|nr:Flp family type IVb pilin [Ferrimonas futtsuensis]
MIKTYAKVQAALTTFKRDERGVTAIEYGLIGVAMAAMLAGVLASTDGKFLAELQQAFESIAKKLTAATPTT